MSAGSERDSSRAGDYRRPSARRQEMGNIERCWLLRDSRPLRATADESEAARLPGIGVAVVGPFVPETTLRGAVEEIVWLRAVLGRIAAGHAHAPKLAGEAVDESETRLPLGGSRRCAPPTSSAPSADD